MILKEVALLLAVKIIKLRVSTETPVSYTHLDVYKRQELC